MSSEKNKKKYGKAVRISQDVKVYLERRQRGKESYDAILRRLFGLETRKGEAQPLHTYYVIPNNGDPIIRASLAEARGEAILLATKRGIKKAEQIVTVQEIP
jgi:hypothetical protein